eukprot:2958330-Prymnesium_polylepis.2
MSTRYISEVRGTASHVARVPCRVKRGPTQPSYGWYTVDRRDSRERTQSLRGRVCKKVEYIVATVRRAINSQYIAIVAGAQ